MVTLRESRQTKVDRIIALGNRRGHVDLTPQSALAPVPVRRSPSQLPATPARHTPPPVTSSQSLRGTPKNQSPGASYSKSRRRAATPHTAEDSGEDSYPEAPAAQDYDDMFSISDVPLPSVAPQTRHAADTQLDDLPQRDDRPFTFQVARREDLNRGFHETPPKKLVISGDWFLNREPQYSVIGMQEYSPPSPIGTHLFDVGFSARRQMSPERYTNGWSGQEEELIDSADLLQPIVFGREKPPPVDTQPDVTRAASTPPPSPAESNVPPVAPDPMNPAADAFPPAVGDGSPSPPPRNRFIRGVADSRPNPPVPPPQPTARPRSVPRRAASSRITAGAFAGAQDGSDSPASGDNFVPPASPAHSGMSDDDDEHADEPADEDVTAKSLPRKGKGKARAKQRNASAGPSNPAAGGRPTVEVNQEIERVAHRMQVELVDLANKLGLSYETLVRKMGFNQQEVRDVNLSNVFKQVHKQRLIASGKGMGSSYPFIQCTYILVDKQSPAEYNSAFKEWQAEHSDDPEAIAALLAEHAAIPDNVSAKEKPSQQIAKRVSAIAQQMADMVCIQCPPKNY